MSQGLVTYYSPKFCFKEAGMNLETESFSEMNSTNLTVVLRVHHPWKNFLGVGTTF